MHSAQICIHVPLPRKMTLFQALQKWKKSIDRPKNANFQFLINRPIRPIFMIHKLEKVSIHHFDPFPRYWTYNH